ncbi:MAG TPA: hypothetical protein DF613_09790 [Lachnospiraceae bacterium]|nr:hypothetical protein [Lachnospiraceae bacterium]
MSIMENTISMMESLPEADLLKIQNFTRKLFQCHESESTDEAVGRFLEPMSREDFMRDIEIAERQFAAGEYQEMGEAIDDICQELKI